MVLNWAESDRSLDDPSAKALGRRERSKGRGARARGVCSREAKEQLTSFVVNETIAST